MNLEIEGLRGLAGDDDLSGGPIDLEGLAGPEVTNAALNKLANLIRNEGLGGKSRQLINRVRNSLALNRTYVQYWKAKFDQATAPNDTSAALVKATEKQIVGLRASGATE